MVSEESLASPTHALRAATAFYLLLPLGLFAYGWLRPAYALPLVALVVVFLAAAAREVWFAARAKWLVLRTRPAAVGQTLARVAPAALLIAAWLLLSGVGGLGYQNDDYQASNALFKTLIQGHWPLTFQLDGQPVRLVYYVGYYLPAAAVGKLLGWPAANAALWVWTATGCGLVFAWFWRLSRVAPQGQPVRLLLLAAFFCLAGGLDFIAATVLQGAPPGPTAHLEFWAGYFQYSSNTTLLYWVPQQALAAWLMLSLVVDALYQPHDLRWLSLSLAAGLLWSPLGAVGLLPYLFLLVMVYLRHARWRAVLRPAAFGTHAAALLLAVVTALYLGANRYQFPKGWIWQGAPDPGLLARFYLGFWWAEIGAVAVVLLVCLVLGVNLRPAHGWLDRLQQRFSIEPMQLTVLALSSDDPHPAAPVSPRLQQRPGHARVHPVAVGAVADGRPGAVGRPPRPRPSPAASGLSAAGGPGGRGFLAGTGRSEPVHSQQSLRAAAARVGRRHGRRRPPPPGGAARG